MEIAIISASNPNYMLKPGGIRPYVLNLMRIINKKGIKITHVGISFDKSKEFLNSSFIPIIKSEKISEIKYFFTLFLKARGLKFQKFTIIHAQRPDLILPFVIFYRKNPKLCTLHGIAHKDIYRKKGIIIGTIYRLIEKISLKHMNRIIAVDEKTEQFYITLYPWLKNKINIIPVGINTEVFRPIDQVEIRKKYGFNKNDKIILFVGRFEKVKGLDLLLKSFKEIENERDDCKLLLVGNGKERKNLENFAEHLGLKKIIFMDMLEHDKIFEIMNCADVFALSSFHEGMPTVVLESLACGVPVVSTEVGDVNKAVFNGISGYLINNRIPEDMAIKLTNVLNNGNNYKANCIEIAKAYSWENIGDEILEIYKKTAL